MLASILVSQALLLAVAAHAGLIGSAAAAGLWRALPETADHFPLRAFFALALGLALQITLLFVIGVAGGLYAGVLIGVGVASGVVSLGYLRGAKTVEWAWKTELLIAAVLYIVVAANAVRVPGFFDDTLYHLPLARFYAETHGLGLDAWVRFPLFPQNIELLFALAFVLHPGDAVLAQGLAAFPAFVIALGLIGAARWLRGSRTLGVAVAVAFLGLHVVDNLLGYAYIDTGLAMFCFAATLGVVVFGGRAPIGVYLVLGVLAGAAAGCKIHGLILAALVFPTLAASRPRPAALLAFAGATALFGCGWYARSFWISGDPISPAGGAWFGYFLWNAEDLAMQKAEQASFLRNVRISNAPFAMVKGGANLVIPAILAPLAAPRERRAILALWATFLAYLLFWFYFSQIDRYLAPVLAIGVLLSFTLMYDFLVYLFARLAPRALAFVGRPTPAAATIAVLLIGYGLHAFARANEALSNWDATLNSRYGYAAFREASSLTPRYGTRLMQIGFEGSAYFFDGDAIGDWFGRARYSQSLMLQGAKPFRLVPAARMRDAMRGFDAKMLAVNLNFARFDEADYASLFDVILEDGEQALLALKPAS